MDTELKRRNSTADLTAPKVDAYNAVLTQTQVSGRRMLSASGSGHPFAYALAGKIYFCD